MSHPLPLTRVADDINENPTEGAMRVAEIVPRYLTRGRLPDDAELEEAITLREMFGSLRRAFEVVQSVVGREQWATLQRERAQDLLVYLALERFSERHRFSVLPRDLQRDVKAFFGTYTRACEAADRLLFSVGDMAAINAACQEAACGKLLSEALYVHRRCPDAAAVAPCV